MKKLKDILAGIKHKLVQGNEGEPVSSVEFDSRKDLKGAAFFAVSGTQTDGHKFIDQAIEKGAKHIICEKLPEEKPGGVNFVQVDNSSTALAKAASNYFDNPSHQLKLLGVTGTNGKTTIVTLLYHLFRELGYPSGMLSTIRVLIDDTEIAATHTTPDPIQINQHLAKMVDAGCEYCFMEVSSHAVVQNRVSGLNFKGGIFTNITHDHLDYHKTFDAYIKAKKQFFDQLGEDAFALVNGDDKHASVMLQNTRAREAFYALKNPAEFKARIIESDFNGMHLNINGQDFFSPKVGRFNAYNVMAVYASSLLLDQDKNEVLQVLSKPFTVEGRFEILKNENGVFGIIDYAHTPDALENVLSTINDVNQGRNEIITVFGCGGNRDKTKRPKMGSIAARLSHKTVITSDNPRFEEPDDIIRDVEAGLTAEQLRHSLSISDREQAIKTACSIAQSGDIILVAGKGHEKYQDVKGEKKPFDDKEILANYLKETE